MVPHVKFNFFSKKRGKKPKSFLPYARRNNKNHSYCHKWLLRFSFPKSDHHRPPEIENIYMFFMKTLVPLVEWNCIQLFLSRGQHWPEHHMFLITALNLLTSIFQANSHSEKVNFSLYKHGWPKKVGALISTFKTLFSKNLNLSTWKHNCNI